MHPPDHQKDRVCDSGLSKNTTRTTEIIDNFLYDSIQEDFVLLCEQLVESEIEDGSDIELDDLLVAIQLKIK